MIVLKHHNFKKSIMAKERDSQSKLTRRRNGFNRASTAKT